LLIETNSAIAAYFENARITPSYDPLEPRNGCAGIALDPQAAIV
jgi:hypothetical protein